jgi:radical SAM protein (TIGR01212 family)
VDAGLGCPNADGALARSGCIFCNIDSFSPSRRRGVRSITEQIREGTGRLKRRYGVEHFLAYFQPATNTFAPVKRLREAYLEALAQPGIVGLAIGTRPDCVSPQVLDLLAELSRQTWLIVEYGLQTIHDRSLEWLNRRHHYDAFLDAVQRSRQRQLDIGAHVILGIPGETPEQMRATAREIARLRIDSVKIHNLYVCRETPLADLWAAGQVPLADREQYADYVADFLELLPPGCVIDRLSGEAPPEYLLAPDWCRDKSAVLRAIEAELVRRDSWQGKRVGSGEWPETRRGEKRRRGEEEMRGTQGE